MTDERTEQILRVIRSLGEGEVVTYGDIAADAGFPKQSRLVGRILATTDEDVPWWRVVNAVGRLVPGNESVQRDLLAGEGVMTDGRRVLEAPVGRFSRRRRAPQHP